MRPQVRLNVCSSNKSKVSVSGRASYQSTSSIKQMASPNAPKPSGFFNPKAVSAQHGPLDNHLDFPEESRPLVDVLEHIVRKDLQHKYPPLPPRASLKRDSLQNKTNTPSEAEHSFKLGKTSSVGLLKKNYSHKSLAHFTPGSQSSAPGQKFAFSVVRSPQQAQKSQPNRLSPAPNKQKLLSEHAIDSNSPAASKDSDCSAPSSSHARDRQHPPSKFRIKVSLCPKPVH